MGDDDDGSPSKSSWWQIEDPSPDVASPKTSNFPKIPIKIPIIHRIRNKSKRKDRTILIPEDVAVDEDSRPFISPRKPKQGALKAPSNPSSPIMQRFRAKSRPKERSISIPEDVTESPENAPFTPTTTRKTQLDDGRPTTPPEIRRQRIFDSIDKATSMEKDIISSFSPDKVEKKPPSLSPAGFQRLQSEGSFDRWNSYSTLRTAELSTSTASSPFSSPHTHGSSGRHRHRVRASLSQSKSSLNSTPEFMELSPDHPDSKRSLTISELGSKRSLTISELGSSFSTRPPRSSTTIRNSGSSSSQARASGGSSSQVLPSSMTGSRRSLSARSMSATADPTERSSFRSSLRSSSMRSSARSTVRSSRTADKRKKTEKQLSLAQSSSVTSLEQYGKLSQRRSSATQESIAATTKKLYEELEGGELSSILKTGGAGSRHQRRSSHSSRSQRSRSLRSGRSASRRSSSRRSGSPSHRQRSLRDLMTHSLVLSDSSSDDGISSLDDSPSVEAVLRQNLAKASKESTPPSKKESPPRKQRRKSQKEKNDKMDRLRMQRRGSRDLSISLHTGDSSMRNSKSQDSSDRLYSTHESTSSMVIAHGSSRRSARTSGHSKPSTRTSGNSKRTSRTVETKKKSSPRRKSAAATLRDVPRSIEFVTKVPPSPTDPLDDAKSKSSKASSSKSSPTSSKSSSKLSPKSSKSSSKSSPKSTLFSTKLSSKSTLSSGILSPKSSTSSSKQSSRKFSPKSVSTGARRNIFRTKSKKKSKKFSKKDQDQSSASHASESLPSLFGTALCLDLSSHHNPTTSPFLQYDVTLNDAAPQSAVRQQSLGSLISRGSATSLRKNSFGSLASGDFILTEEEDEGGASGGMTSPSVSLESDFFSAASPPIGLPLPNLQHKKTKKKPPSVKKKKNKRKKQPPTLKDPPPTTKDS